MALRLRVYCQLFYPELISTGQTLTELCESLQEKGVALDVYCAKPSLKKLNTKRYEIYKNIKVKRLFSTSFSKLNIVGKLVNHIIFSISVFFHLLFSSNKHPILMLTNPPFLSIIIYAVSFFRNHRFIYLIFDIYPETATNLGVLSKNSPITKIWQYINQTVMKKVSHIVIIGRCMNTYVPTTITTPISLVNMWTDDNHVRSFKNKPNPYVKKWGLETKFIVLYSGNMGRFHDMETILDAAKLCEDEKDIIFLFIGDGHKKKLVEDASKSLSNCIVKDFVPRKDLGHPLHMSDCGLVCLNDGQEGLSVPSKTYAMMAAGLPIFAVMNEKSEIATMVKEENCGQVFNNGDAIELATAIKKLKNNKAKQDNFSKNAVQAIKRHYNLNQSSSDLIEIIKLYQ